MYWIYWIYCTFTCLPFWYVHIFIYIYCIYILDIQVHTVTVHTVHLFALLKCAILQRYGSSWNIRRQQFPSVQKPPDLPRPLPRSYCAFFSAIVDCRLDKSRAAGLWDETNTCGIAPSSVSWSISHLSLLLQLSILFSIRPDNPASPHFRYCRVINLALELEIDLYLQWGNIQRTMNVQGSPLKVRYGSIQYAWVWVSTRYQCSVRY